MKIGDKRSGASATMFEEYSGGIKTNRDAWCFNFSHATVADNIAASIDFYNSEVDRYLREGIGEAARSFVITDAKKISWDRVEFQGVERGRKISFDKKSVTKSLYRPFSRGWVYFNRTFNNCVYKMPQIFPEKNSLNRVICLSGPGTQRGVSCLMSGDLPDVHTVQTGQCFPLYLYNVSSADDGLFSSSGEKSDITRRDAVSDEGLAHFQTAYQGEEINKEDLFYYIYGLLHSPDYRERFNNNLAKALPRIPAVKTFADFAAFRDAGRALGDLHVNFESVEPYMVTFKEGTHDLIPEAQADPVKFYRVTKMKFGGKGKEKDKTTVIYNANITMQNVPLEAYGYVVNGKPALEWVMERQVVKQDKASGIFNDANDYANETVGDPRYPMELFQRVITVSLETMRIVNGLPGLAID